jgi:hypothetical protein
MCSVNLADGLGYVVVSIAMCSVNSADGLGCVVVSIAMCSVNSADGLGYVVVSIAMCSILNNQRQLVLAVHTESYYNGMVCHFSN